MDSTLYRFKSARIVMFFGGHPPAHVHLLGPGLKVSIEVATLTAKGRVDAKTLAEARAWIEANREAIMRTWIERGAKR